MFSHPSKLELIEEARALGFRIILFHINVDQADLSVARVKERVKEGGHDVPEEKVRARFLRNAQLIRKAVLMADHAFIYDNSELNAPPKRIMIFKNGRVLSGSAAQPDWSIRLYGPEMARAGLFQ